MGRAAGERYGAGGGGGEPGEPGPAWSLVETTVVASGITLTDDDQIVRVSLDPAGTLNLPAVPDGGQLLLIHNVGPEAVTLVGNGATIAPNWLDANTLATGQGVTLVYVEASDTWHVVGDTAIPSQVLAAGVIAQGTSDFSAGALTAGQINVATLNHAAGIALQIAGVSKLTIAAGTVSVLDELLISDALRLAAEAEKVANYTATATDSLVAMNGANLQLTLPAAPAADQYLWIYNRHATSLVVKRDEGDPEGGGVTIATVAPSSGLLLWYQSTPGWRVLGRSIPEQLAAGATTLGALNATGGQLLLGDGTAGAPAIAFAADADTGLARISAAFCQIFGGAGVSEYVAGVQRMVNSSQLQLADGAVGTPALAFAGDTDTGLYAASAGGNEVRAAGGGAFRLGMGSPLVSNVQHNANNILLLASRLAVDAETKKTGNYTIANTDAIVIVEATTPTLTLPATPGGSQMLWIRNNHASSAATIGRNGKSINGAAADLTLNAGKAICMQYDSTEWWVVSGSPT